jgi:formate hydrogenlyase transcriptional activator
MGAAWSNTDLDRPGSRATNTTASSPSVEELVAFERMLADLSARMANVTADRVEPEIQLAQVVLRQFLGFDRSTFAEFQDDSSLVVVSSTAVEGVDPTPLGPLPPQLDWFIAKLRAGETLVIQDPADDLPPEAVGEAEYIQRTGLRSHLSIPLRIGGRVVGAIAFSAFRETRNWPDDLISRVMLVGEVFAHAIARKREHEKLLAAMAEIRLLKDRLERENSYLKQVSQVRPLQRLSSRSPRFLSVVEEIKQVAMTSSTVLLLGKPEAVKKCWPRRSTTRAPKKIGR